MCRQNFFTHVKKVPIGERTGGSCHYRKTEAEISGFDGSTKWCNNEGTDHIEAHFSEK